MNSVMLLSKIVCDLLKKCYAILTCIELNTKIDLVDLFTLYKIIFPLWSCVKISSSSKNKVLSTNELITQVEIRTKAIKNTL